MNIQGEHIPLAIFLGLLFLSLIFFLHLLSSPLLYLLNSQSRSKWRSRASVLVICFIWAELFGIPYLKQGYFDSDILTLSSYVLRKWNVPSLSTPGFKLQPAWVQIYFWLIPAWAIFKFWISGPSKVGTKEPKYINSNGYVVLSQVNELEHRFIAKQILGRDLKSNEVVHHINGIKTDNDVGNLCLLDREKHEFFHSWLKWKSETTGKYPRIAHQMRALEEEYGGSLLKKLKLAKPVITTEQKNRIPSNEKRRCDAQVYLLQKLLPCWECKEEIQAVSVAIEPLETSPVDDHSFFILNNITQLPEKLLARVSELAPQYKLTFSRRLGSSYFMNHCDKCGAPFSDYYLHETPGAPFSPITEDEAKSVKLIKMDFPIYYEKETPNSGVSTINFEGIVCRVHYSELIRKLSER